jgi:nucleoside recognition membrane protein YjiH
MEFITGFLEGLFDVGAVVLSGVGELFSSAIGVVYGGTPTPAITDIGWVIIAVFGVPLAIGVFNWLLGQLRKIKPAPGSAKK